VASDRFFDQQLFTGGKISTNYQTKTTVLTSGDQPNFGIEKAILPPTVLPHLSSETFRSNA